MQCKESCKNCIIEVINVNEKNYKCMDKADQNNAKILSIIIISCIVSVITVILIILICLRREKLKKEDVIEKKIIIKDTKNKKLSKKEIKNTTYSLELEKDRNNIINDNIERRIEFNKIDFNKDIVNETVKVDSESNANTKFDIVSNYSDSVKMLKYNCNNKKICDGEVSEESNIKRNDKLLLIENNIASNKYKYRLKQNLKLKINNDHIEKVNNDVINKMNENKI